MQVDQFVSVKYLKFVLVVLFVVNWSANATAQVTSPLPVGFAAADTNADGMIAETEWTVYLQDRLKDESLPFQQMFEKLDVDQDGILSSAEFDNRHSVLEAVAAQADEATLPEDPGRDFIPYSGLDQPLNDQKIFGAIYHRYFEQVEQRAAWKTAGWKRSQLENVPATVSRALPPWDGQKPTLDQMIRATMVIAGGGSDDEFFVGGAVIISPDGLAITNYHIAEAFNKKLVGLLANGQVVKVIEFVAGNRATDVAIVKLDGSDFPWVPMASKAPAMADDIVAMHHTENRFFTYDRGYVKRYPLIGKHPWMEISADYAPGGSGCGIFNSNHELVGLVSTIVMGDGPMIASAELMEETADSEEDWFGDEEDSEGAIGLDPGALVVKLAVPWTAMQAMLKKPE